jgi:dTDP-4-dehydrorhamnose 3,5-epimerase
MRFVGLDLAGAFIVEPEPHRDERGLFARTFCTDEFSDRGLNGAFVQNSTSWNAKSGTLRGMHFQRPPAAEAKLVRCTAGRIWDVIVDLRPGSPTFHRHAGIQLSAENRLALYIPEGFAHGFQTLDDGSEVFYQMTRRYAPDLAGGLRYDDPTLGIEWPLVPTVISERDRSWPLIRS